MDLSLLPVIAYLLYMRTYTDNWLQAQVLYSRSVWQISKSTLDRKKFGKWIDLTIRIIQYK